MVPVRDVPLLEMTLLRLLLLLLLFPLLVLLLLLPLSNPLRPFPATLATRSNEWVSREGR